MEKVTDSCGFYMGFRFCCGFDEKFGWILVDTSIFDDCFKLGKEVRNCEVGNRLNSAWHDHQSIGIHIYQLCLHMPRHLWHGMDDQEPHDKLPFL